MDKKIEDKKLELFRLYDLINMTNRRIQSQKDILEPDDIQFQQLIQLKERFTKELFALLSELQLDFHLAAA
jgi:hypothetical protein